MCTRDPHKPHFEVTVDTHQLTSTEAAIEFLQAKPADTACGKIAVDYFHERENKLISRVDFLEFQNVQLNNVVLEAASLNNDLRMAMLGNRPELREAHEISAKFIVS